MTRKITIGRELYRFESEQEWILYGELRGLHSGLEEHERVALDSMGRICCKGCHFVRATLAKMYPVIVYAVDVQEEQ